MHTTLRTLLLQKGGTTQSVPPDSTVADAVAVMNVSNVGSVLVMDGARLVGIFTERDVLRRVVGNRMAPEKTLISEVMTRHPAVMRPTSTVADAMAVVSEKRVRHLPVVEEGRVLGVISAGDLNHWLIRGHQVEIDQLVDYITQRYPA
jgi:CBS domain-containing protein